MRPNVRYIEELVAGSPIRSSLELCDSERVRIIELREGAESESTFYSSEMVNEKSHVVVERCVIKDDVMLSGKVMFGTREDRVQDPAELGFFKDVKKVARKLNNGTICHLDFHPLTARSDKVFPTYIVAEGTHHWLKNEEFAILRERYVELYFMTIESIEVRQSRFF